MARVVVVGAGLGGLAAAVRLRAAGHEVAVHERAGHVGGKLGWYSRDGFGFDTGPSLLTLPAVYRDLFATTGPPLEDVVDLVPVDPVFRYRFGDGTVLDVPGGSRGALADALDGALGAGAGRQWLGLLEHAGRVWDVTRGPFLEQPLAGARGLLQLARRTDDLRTVAPWRSLRALGRRHLDHPHLRTLLDRYATYTGSDPRRAPAALVTVPYVEQAFGAWYVRGGLRRLAEAVAGRAEALGADVRTGSGVDRVLLDGGGRARGVRLDDGAELPADVVVVNADAARLYRDLLPPDLPAGVAAGVRRARAGLRAAPPSLSGFVLLLALRGRASDLRHHTVLFPADYDAEFDAVFGRGRRLGRPCPVPDPTVYVAAPDDPATRPDGDSEAWFVLVNAPRHTPGDRRAGVDWDAPGLADA
jgi:phytoene desaturase